MGIHKYNLEGKIADILIESGLHWYATGRLGLDMFVGNDLSKVDIFSVYVPQEEEAEWKKYITSKNATSVERNPTLNIILTTDYFMMIQATFEQTRGLSKELHRHRKKEQESYKDLLELESKISQKRLQPRYSFDTQYTHLVSKERLERDGRMFAARYLSNVYTTQHNKEPTGNVHLRQLKPSLGLGN